MARRLVLEDFEEDLRELDRRGLTIGEQASKLGVTPRAVQRARTLLGLGKGKSPMVEITPEIDALLQQAVKEGWSREEAYRTTGVSHRRLKRLYPGLNMPPVERGTVGALARQENQQARGHRENNLGGAEPFRWPAQ